MKNVFTLIAALSTILLLTNCENNKPFVSGGGNIPLHRPAVQINKRTVATQGIFYGNYFNSPGGSYLRLLESCRRCGTDLVFDTPGGGTHLKKYFWVPSNDPKRCVNWLSEGYVQVEFKQNALPTQATVHILPKYKNSHWGQSFHVSGTANAINRNKGFEIILSPGQGLGGSYTLRIHSRSSNHVTTKSNKLNMIIEYGSNSDNYEEVIQVDNLVRLNSPTVTGFLKCDQYTNL